MNKQDMNEIWRLLGRYREGDKHLKDQGLLRAWYDTLKPYEASTVRDAVAAYFRRKHYWPDVGEITALCPPPAEPCRVERDDMERLRRTWSGLVKRRQAVGVPATITEAREAGLDSGVWFQLLVANGLALG